MIADGACLHLLDPFGTKNFLQSKCSLPAFSGSARMSYCHPFHNAVAYITSTSPLPRLFCPQRTHLQVPATAASTDFSVEFLCKDVKEITRQCEVSCCHIDYEPTMIVIRMVIDSIPIGF